MLFLLIGCGVASLRWFLKNRTVLPIFVVILLNQLYKTATRFAMRIKSFQIAFSKNRTVASNGFVYTKPILHCKMLVGNPQTLELHHPMQASRFAKRSFSTPQGVRSHHGIVMITGFGTASQQANEHSEILISCVNLGLCTYKAPACCGCIRNRMVPRSIACSCFALLLNCQIVLQLLYWVYQNFFGRMLP